MSMLKFFHFLTISCRNKYTKDFLSKYVFFVIFLHWIQKEPNSIGKGCIISRQLKLFNLHPNYLGFTVRTFQFIFTKLFNHVKSENFCSKRERKRNLSESSRTRRERERERERESERKRRKRCEGDNFFHSSNSSICVFFLLRQSPSWHWLSVFDWTLQEAYRE